MRLPVDDDGSLEETLNILADADLMRQIAQAQQELAAGEWYDEADDRAALLHRRPGRAGRTQSLIEFGEQGGRLG